MTAPASLTTLITGLPRSGTTLTTALLNRQPDTLALIEPMALSKMPRDAAGFTKEVAAFARHIRKSVHDTGQIRMLTIDGKVPGNLFQLQDSNAGLRSFAAQKQTVDIDKPLSEQFRLYIKHPAAFTALWRPLSEAFPLFACIRSPLAVLASWNTVDIPINRGRLPMGERFDPELSRRLDAIPAPLDRQVEIMRWFLDIYARLPPERVLRFEDMIRDPMQSLAKIHPGLEPVTLDRENQSLSERYPAVDLDRLRAALKPIEGLIRHHYPEGLPD